MTGYAKAYEQAQQLRKEQTQAEEVLWQKLRNRKLNGHKFCRQVPIGPFIVDFCCREKKLVIEVDGLVHKKQQEYDNEREKILIATGYSIVRFTNGEVFNDLPSVLERILSSLDNK